MRLGVFADTHDHLDYIRRAVEVLNAEQCELVVFAGDFVSSHAVPPLRQLQAPVIACFGDNEGNRIGVAAGMRIVGTLGEPPFGFRTADGTRVLLTHMLQSLQSEPSDFDVCIYAHTHRAEAHFDSAGRLIINPGEASGWTSGAPTVAIVETQPRSARFVRLDGSALVPPGV